MDTTARLDIAVLQEAVAGLRQEIRNGSNRLAVTVAATVIADIVLRAMGR